MLEVVKLTKYYHQHLAVDAVNFTLEKGHAVGFLGPNGAGKSTLMRMLAGILSPSSGEIFLNGERLGPENTELKSQIGYMQEQPALYKEMRVKDYLQFVAVMKGIARSQINRLVEEAIFKSGLTGEEDRRLGSFSKGYRQRAALAQALIGNPPLLLLDEPTAGLDPVQLLEIRKLISQLKSEHTLLISTHILSEVYQSCDEILMIQKGKLKAHASVEKLAAETLGYLLRFENPPDDFVMQLQELSYLKEVKKISEGLVSCLVARPADLQQLLGFVVIQGWSLKELRPQQNELEALFLEDRHG